MLMFPASLFGTIAYFANTPCEALGGAAGSLHEMIARIPFQRCVVGAERLLQVFIFPAYVVANLCKNLVACMFLTVAEAEIDVGCLDGMQACIVQPSRNPHRG